MVLQLPKLLKRPLLVLLLLVQLLLLHAYHLSVSSVTDRYNIQAATEAAAVRA